MRTTIDARERLVRPFRRASGRPVRGTRSVAMRLGLAALLAGCGALEPVAPYSPITDPSKLFMSLTLDHEAVNLSTAPGYGELQLAATPRDALGEPIVGLPAPTYRSSDTTRVWVTADGLLQARKSGTRVLVIAELVAPGNVRHADTAFVNVTTLTAPPVLASLSIDPATPEEAVWSMMPTSNIYGQLIFQLEARINFLPRLVTRVLGSDGKPITGLVVAYESLDPDIVNFGQKHTPTVGRPPRPGTVTIVARTTAYGITKVDTATYTVTLPVLHGINIQQGATDGPSTVAPQTVTIRRGGYVGWSNLTADSVRVSFDEPSRATAVPELCTAIGGVFCDGGDIPNFALESSTNEFLRHTRIRQFVEPGTYTYHIEPLGVTGRVIVADETTP